MDPLCLTAWGEGGDVVFLVSCRALDSCRCQSHGIPCMVPPRAVKSSYRPRALSATCAVHVCDDNAVAECVVSRLKQM